MLSWVIKMLINVTKDNEKSMRKNLIISAGSRHIARKLANCVLVLSVLAAAGCGKESTEKQSTQVAAKVNNSEITVHQVNQVLQASGAGGLTEDSSRKALDSLIDQELLVQKAISNHLDRDPDVVMEMENARRQILSQTYVQRQVLDHTSIEAKAKQDYYQKNPDLFSKRRVYQFQIFNLEAPKLDPALNTALEQALKPEQVRELLNQYQVKYQEETVAKPAEQLPLELLGAFAKAKIGDIIIMPQAQSKVLLMQVTNLAERSVSLEQAQVQIEQFLTNTRNKQALDEHLKKLRAAATLAYQGDFTKPDKAIPAQPAQQTAPPSDTKPEPDKQKILEQGLSGLK